MFLHICAQPTLLTLLWLQHRSVQSNANSDHDTAAVPLRTVIVILALHH